MSVTLRSYWASSILKKQIVAITGLIMVGFILGHLAGNCLIFLGPHAFNGYAEKLQSLGELLWVVRLGMLTAIVIHIGLTVLLTLENREARSVRYAVTASKADRGFARKTMIYTGILVICFVSLHLFDFTLADKTGPAGVLGKSNEGLFGLVWNSFLNPLRDLFYVLAVCSVGLHVSHGIQSLLQTIGFEHPRYTPLILKASVVIGIVVAVGFSSIPVYILLRQYVIGI